MEGRDERFGDFLVDNGYISKKALSKGIIWQFCTGLKLGESLVHGGILHELQMLRMLGEFLDVPVAHLENLRVSRAVREAIPRETAYHHTVMPLALRELDGEEVLLVATAEPENEDLLEELSEISGYTVVPFLSGKEEILVSLDRNYRYSEASVTGLEDTFFDLCAAAI